MAKNDDKEKKKYKWTASGGKVNCCTSETSSCTVSKLWEPLQLTSHHDAQLQQATREINEILDGVKKRNRYPARELCFIQIRDRHFLVWSHHDLVGPDDDDETVRKMLRLPAS